MMPNNSNDTWPADVKNAARRDIDPNVLPEYTLLPTSPPQSVVSYDESPPLPQAQAGHSHCHSPSNAGAPQGNANSNLNSNANSNAAEAPTCGAETLRIAKLLYIGLLALAVPPVLLACLALAMGAVALYGCGKVLEGTGRALAVGPEAAYRAWVAERAGRFWRAVRGPGGESGGCCGGSGNRDLEGQTQTRSGRDQDEREREEEIGFVEGQVALVDVEASRAGGPISI